jgi:methionyl-tRNA synthetase
LSRLTALCQKAEFGYFNRPDNVQALAGLHEAITSFEFDKALKLIWHNLAWINRDIDEKQPWKDLKAGNVEQLKKELTIWFVKLYEVGYWLSPFMPETAEKIKDTLTRKPIHTSAPLFNRLKTSKNVEM